MVLYIELQRKNHSVLVLDDWLIRGVHYFDILRKILQHKRDVKASFWDPSNLTQFNGYFDEDSSSYPHQNTRVEMCEFNRIPMPHFKVSFILQIFSRCRFEVLIWLLFICAHAEVISKLYLWRLRLVPCQKQDRYSP